MQQRWRIELDVREEFWVRKTSNTDQFHPKQEKKKKLKWQFFKKKNICWACLLFPFFFLFFFLPLFYFICSYEQKKSADCTRQTETYAFKRRKVNEIYFGEEIPITTKQDVQCEAKYISNADEGEKEIDLHARIVESLIPRVDLQGYQRHFDQATRWVPTSSLNFPRTQSHFFLQNSIHPFFHHCIR